MVTSGVLMVADALLTVAWQEPVSALLTGRQQSRLDDELEAASRLAAADRRALASAVRQPRDRRRSSRRLYAAMAERHARRTQTGEAVGRIELPTLRRSYAVIEGTDVETLRKGPGHYPETPLPGQRGTVGVAGHRTTNGAPFRTIDRLRRGDPVIADMPYGRFTYRVERTRIVEPTALWVTRPAAHDRLILSACHPLYSAERRIVVFARLEEVEPA